MDDHELKDGMFTMFEIRLRIIVVSKIIRDNHRQLFFKHNIKSSVFVLKKKNH